jgi:hypothetical protein
VPKLAMGPERGSKERKFFNRAAAHQHGLLLVAGAFLRPCKRTGVDAGSLCNGMPSSVMDESLPDSCSHTSIQLRPDCLACPSHMQPRTSRRFHRLAASVTTRLLGCVAAGPNCRPLCLSLLAAVVACGLFVTAKGQTIAFSAGSPSLVYTYDWTITKSVGGTSASGGSTAITVS